MSVYLQQLLEDQSWLSETIHTFFKQAELSSIPQNDYKLLKKRFLVVRSIIENTDPDSDHVEKLVTGILEGARSGAWGWGDPTRNFTTRAWQATVGRITGQGKPDVLWNPDSIMKTAEQPDPEFLNSLPDLIQVEPRFSEAATQLMDWAHSWAMKKVKVLGDSLAQKILLAHERKLEKQLQEEKKEVVKTRTHECFVAFRKMFRPVLAGVVPG